MSELTKSEKEKLRNKVLEKLQNKIKRTVYDAFLKDTYIYNIEDNTLIIACSSSLNANYIESRLLKEVNEAITEVTETNFQVKFLGLQDLKKNKANTPLNNYEKHPIYTNNLLKPELNFENFVVGTTNQVAQRASLAVANSLGTMYNPLFIYSMSGLGKTHLLNAIGNYVSKEFNDKKILFCTAQDFIDEYVNYVRKDTDFNLKNYINSFDVLLIDDIQLLQNKTKTEEFFFGIFEDFTKNNKQIVLTCDRLPDELNGLDQRLVTRFSTGLTTLITAPTKELCEEILRKKIANSSLSIEMFDDEVIKFVAKTFKNNIRELEGALNRLIFWSTLNNLSHIDIEEASNALQILKDSKKTKSKVSTQKIINVVCDYYKTNPSAVMSSLRTNNVLLARQVSIYLIRTILDLPFKDIGDLFSGKDHTTIMHSVTKIEEMLKKDDSFQQIINKLKKQIV